MSTTNDRNMLVTRNEHRTTTNHIKYGPSHKPSNIFHDIRIFHHITPYYHHHFPQSSHNLLYFSNIIHHFPPFTITSHLFPQLPTSITNYHISHHIPTTFHHTHPLYYNISQFCSILYHYLPYIPNEQEITTIYPERSGECPPSNPQNRN